MTRLLSLVLATVIALSFLGCITKVQGDASEPSITVIPVASAGPTDRWDIKVDFHNGSRETIYVNGTMSDLQLSSLNSVPLGAASYHTTATTTVTEQDILLGFSYSWNYTLGILGKVVDILAFNLGLCLPVRIKMQYSTPMIVGSSYPINITLTPFDKPDSDEFVCNFRVLGAPVFDLSQSFVTPIGSQNAWAPAEIGPFYFLYGLPFIFFNLDVGLGFVPKLFSDQIEALISTTGNAILQTPSALIWNAPNQTLQASVLAIGGDLGYASTTVSQVTFYLNKLLIDVNLALRFNGFWGSSEFDFTIFTVDASSLLPTLSFGTHPSSSVSQIRVDVPVLPHFVIPEVPVGTILTVLTMFGGFVVYSIVPRKTKRNKMVVH